MLIGVGPRNDDGDLMDIWYNYIRWIIITKYHHFM